MKNKQESQETKLAARASETVPVRRATSLLPPFGGTPFEFMRRITSDMERMFEDFNFFSMTPPFYPEFRFPELPKFEETAWLPNVEVAQNKGLFTVRADLPGLKKEDINVELTDDAVVISGERKHESKEEREGFFRSERSYGSFYRSIPLPEGADANKATASFQNGVLEVGIAAPKKELKTRKLEIAEKGEKSHAKAAG